MNIDVIKLENGKEYGIIDTFTHNGSNYLILSNIGDFYKHILLSI